MINKTIENIMEDILDFQCCECSDCFDSAFLLLQHFAKHVRKRKIPDLYPINIKKVCIKNANKNCKIETTNVHDTDSGVEIEESKICFKNKINKIKINNSNKEKNGKKYICNICSRRFGWSTDLKRHILTHTGEKPFKCLQCEACFTRKFLLENHCKKNHS